MRLASRVNNLAPSFALDLHYRYREMLRQGKDVVSFAVGEPDFETPAHIKKAGIEAIEQGWTKYSATQGYPELREAICALLKKNYHLEYDPPSVIVSVGAKHSILNALLALVEPGDEVLIPIPGWFSYIEQVKLLDAVPVFVPTPKEENFQLRADALAERISPKTRVLILNSPNNPTGAMVEEKELAKIAALAVKHNFYVISDEIYCEINFGDIKHVSFATLDKRVKDLTITINGFSKTYAMTGWRVGYAAGPRKIIDVMGTIQGHSTSGTNSMAQRAAIAAVYGPQDFIKEMVQEYARRRDYIVDRLNSIPGISCLTPPAAFYVFPDISQLLGKKFQRKEMKTSFDLGNYFLDNQGVAVIPGSAFAGEGHMRLSFACSMEVIQSGCDRIARAASQIM